MLRQRLRAETSPVALVGRVLLLVLSAVLVWYGLMVVLLALDVDPDAVNAISGYRDIYDFFAGLEGGDITGWVRLITGLAGIAAFLLFGWLAWKEWPRPYLARGKLSLKDDERGVVDVGPRAVERAAELAALAHASVTSATARYGSDDLALDIDLRRSGDLPETLRAVQRSATESLRRHRLPVVPVHVTMTGYERKTRRELQ